MAALDPALVISELARSAAEVSEEMTAAVLNWVEESNGRVECGVYALRPGITPEHLSGAVLARLDFAPFEGATAADLEITRIAPASALAQLFGAAVSGGAYNHGHGGAYGRLEAWRSLGALAGENARAGLDLARIETAAQAGAWWSFSAATPWFARVAWDLGVAVLRPGGTTLALLAATDTD